ncbi:MAG TPA: T9SS type A sorting domain-containing protein [Bacteroidales bacterium]|nr:T9SS type A sorting domain-containing protein [Bacteroidales bacterium]
MRKTLFLLITSIFLANILVAQCPGCVTNVGCTSNPAAPTICPSVMPDGYAMQPYDEDISFYLPTDFETQGHDVELFQLDILNVTGLPFGLSFQTSASPSNIYYPTDNPPTTEHGCAKICGTPIMPGTYNITVFVLAHVHVTDLGGITQTSNSSFILPITILPSPASNNGFSITNSFGCAPLSTGFTCNRPSNGNPNYSYLWNFGNGNQSISENPPVQNYINPGSYPVTLETQIDTLPYYLESLTVNASPDCNDSPFSAPDYYFILKLNTSSIYTSAYINNTNAPVTFSFSPIPLTNATYTIEIWEYDTGLAGGDDHCGNFSIPGNTAGTYTLTTGTCVITYTISHPILSFTDVDTIEVFQSPVLGTLSFSPNDSLCKNDSVLLAITDTYGGFYQWYNDTNAINNATASTYYAKTNGKYWVEVSNANACRTNSGMKQITFIDNPSKPGTWIVGNTINTNLPGFDLQWYQEGVAIPGATGFSYEVDTSGYYFVMATNWFGCGTPSDTVYVSYIDDIGFGESDVMNGLQLIPNPTTGKFTINFESTSLNEVQINITDLTGRVVYNNTFGATAGHFSQEIDMSSVKKGLYLVQIISGNSKMNTKLIKQ